MTPSRHRTLVDVQFYGGPHDGHQFAIEAARSTPALELPAGHCYSCAATEADDDGVPARVLYRWDGTYNRDGQRRYLLDGDR